MGSCLGPTMGTNERTIQEKMQRIIHFDLESSCLFGTSSNEVPSVTSESAHFADLGHCQNRCPAPCQCSLGKPAPLHHRKVTEPERHKGLPAGGATFGAVGAPPSLVFQAFDEDTNLVQLSNTTCCQISCGMDHLEWLFPLIFIVHASVGRNQSRTGHNMFFRVPASTGAVEKLNQTAVV